MKLQPHMADAQAVDDVFENVRYRLQEHTPVEWMSRMDS